MGRGHFLFQSITKGKKIWLVGLFEFQVYSLTNAEVYHIVKFLFWGKHI